MCPRKSRCFVRDTEEELLERIIRRHKYFENTKGFCSGTRNRADKKPQLLHAAPKE